MKLTQSMSNRNLLSFFGIGFFFIGAQSLLLNDTPSSDSTAQNTNPSDEPTSAATATENSGKSEEVRTPPVSRRPNPELRKSPQVSQEEVERQKQLALQREQRRQQQQQPPQNPTLH